MRRLVASWFGSGLVLGRLRGDDLGSGTLGSVVALIPAWWLIGSGWRVQLVVAVVLIGVALWASAPFADGADPGWVVIDEAAGTFLALVGLAGWPALVAFMVFRVADITKRPPGVAGAERLPGAVGLVADDVVAALWGCAVGWLLTWLVAA